MTRVVIIVPSFPGPENAEIMTAHVILLGVNLPLDADVDLDVTGDTDGTALGHDSDPLGKPSGRCSLSAIDGDGEH